MKTKRVILFIIPTLFTISTTFASFDVNLRAGAKGAEVTKVQKFFIQKGLLDTTIFGNFGALTLKAVKQYQKNNNLPTTGYVGPMTRQIMNQEFSGGSGNSSINSSPTNSVATSTGTTGGNTGNSDNQSANTSLQNNFNNQLHADLLVNNSNVKIGTTFEVELKVNTNTGTPIYTAGATINYDPKVLVYVDSTLDSQWMSLAQPPYWITDNTNGVVTRTAGFSGGLSTSAIFMKYKFKAISSGSTQIFLSKGLSLDVNNNDLGLDNKTLTVIVK